MKKLFSLVFILFFLNSLIITGQDRVSVSEMLGYPAGSKLLILHFDDMGMSHSTNMACMKALLESPARSGSVMVPCPWFPEMAAFLTEHPDIDAGIHLTCTSEWKNYKWGGVLSPCDIPSLLDSCGNFWSVNETFIKKAKPDEVIKEVRAQINRSISAGIKPTHIDAHSGAILMNPVILKQLFSVADEYRLPLTIPMNLVKIMAPHLAVEIPPDVVVVDNYLSMYGEIATGDWTETYTNMIKNLQPGLNELVFHLSYDNDEMKAISEGHDEFGSAWRQKDLDFILGDQLKQLLENNNIILVSWHDICQKIYK